MNNLQLLFEFSEKDNILQEYNISQEYNILQDSNE